MTTTNLDILSTRCTGGTSAPLADQIASMDRNQLYSFFQSSIGLIRRGGQGEYAKGVRWLSVYAGWFEESSDYDRVIRNLQLYVEV